jgi:hypothetical protein
MHDGILKRELNTMATRRTAAPGNSPASEQKTRADPMVSRLAMVTGTMWCGSQRPLVVIQLPFSFDVL